MRQGTCGEVLMNLSMKIRELNTRLAEISSALVSAQQTASAAQALHAGTMQQQFIESDTNKKKKTNWLKKIFRKDLTDYDGKR